MNTKKLYTKTAKLITQNGAPSLYSCGINSNVKGVPVSCSGDVETPERMDLWYMPAPGESSMSYLYLKDIVDIRTCALREGAAMDSVRLTRKNGELYILVLKTPAMAQEFADQLQIIAREMLAANRPLAEAMQLPEVEPVAEKGAKLVMSAAERKTQTYLKLGIILRSIGYVIGGFILIAFIGDRGNTDWTGIGFAILAAVVLIISGSILLKKK